MFMVIERLTQRAQTAQAKTQDISSYSAGTEQANQYEFVCVCVFVHVCVRANEQKQRQL